MVHHLIGGAPCWGMLMPPEWVAMDYEKGARVLNEARAYLTRFVAFPSPEAADTAVLWVAHTHAQDSSRVMVWDATPRLAFVSDEPQSGKSTALELTSLLASRAIRAAEPTLPAIMNMLTEERATIMIDEADLLFGNRGTGHRALRTVLNSGYTRGTYVTRARERVDCFAPVAFAGLASSLRGNPELQALRTRTIMIDMRKRRDSDRIEPYRPRMHRPTMDAVQAALASWAQHQDVLPLLADSWPDLPEGISDRTAQIWEPLLAIADVAGGEWPERCIRAALSMTKGGNRNEPELTPGERIISDIERIRFGAALLPTDQIIRRLYDIPDGPWRTLWPDSIGARRELAALLAQHGVTVRKMRYEGIPLQCYVFTDYPDIFDCSGHSSPEHDQGSDQQCSGSGVPASALALPAGSSGE